MTRPEPCKGKTLTGINCTRITRNVGTLASEGQRRTFCYMLQNVFLLGDKL